MEVSGLNNLFKALAFIDKQCRRLVPIGVVVVMVGQDCDEIMLICL